MRDKIIIKSIVTETDRISNLVTMRLTLDVSLLRRGWKPKNYTEICSIVSDKINGAFPFAVDSGPDGWQDANCKTVGYFVLFLIADKIKYLEVR
jgi:hypothetical protein